MRSIFAFASCFALAAAAVAHSADSAAPQASAATQDDSSNGASPGSPLEEVVVQASLRGETSRELPASVTVLGDETLKQAGLQHFGDVMALVPNLNWSAGTSRPRYFQLRGIGELEQFQGAPNASVGFLIDDIDFSGIGMPATLFDADQVEVLRGPQGTTYGANALAGLISLRTHDPVPESEVRLEATGGDYDTRSAGAVVGGALAGSQTAAYRFVAQHYESDGFRRNVYLNRDDTMGYDEMSLRGKVRWQAAEDLRLDLTAMYVDLDNGYDAFAIDNSLRTHSDKPGRDAQRSLGLATRAEYTGLRQFTVRSTTTFADSDIDYSFDGDWGNDAEWGIYAPYDYTSTFVRSRRTWSEDLRAVSAPGEEIGGRAAWVAGLYVLKATETNDQLDLYNGATYIQLGSRYESTNAAAYGELDVHLAGPWQLRIGGRVERRSADYEDTNAVAFDPKETMFGGHLSLDRSLAGGGLWYTTLSRGYKAGGFNIGVSVPEGRRTFDAEYLWNLETGVKTALLGGRLITDTALFYMRRQNQQVSTSYQPDPTNPLTFIFFTDNAARGENYGLESSLTWAAGRGLSLGGALGILETRYIGYDFDESRSLDGREQAHAPQYQLTLTGEYRSPLGFLARIDAQRVDDFYFDTSHDERAPARTVVNLKLGFERPRWGAYLWARNLFDEHYAVRGFFFANEPPDFIPKRYVQPGDPRQVGVTFNYSFR